MPIKLNEINSVADQNKIPVEIMKDNLIRNKGMVNDKEHPKSIQLDSNSAVSIIEEPKSSSNGEIDNKIETSTLGIHKGFEVTTSKDLVENGISKNTAEDENDIEYELHDEIQTTTLKAEDPKTLIDYDEDVELPVGVDEKFQTNGKLLLEEIPNDDVDLSDDVSDAQKALDKLGGKNSAKGTKLSLALLALAVALFLM
jgi:hypothetical protein